MADPHQADGMASADSLSVTSRRPDKIAIVGSGLIGRSWAMLFASAGYQVCVFDIEKRQLEQAREGILTQLRDLARLRLLRGSLSVEEQYKRVSFTEDLVECIREAIHVQECVPEQVDLKKQIFSQLDAYADHPVALCSSSSAIVPSLFTEHLKNRSKCLVAHPINPPFYCRLVELVPAPWTDPGIVQRTRELMTSIGQAPITLKKEIAGFIQPRIQYAILAECWRLVQAGVISVPDVETAVVEGLAPRYAFMGPFETCHLNADGMSSYLERFGKTIYDIQKSFGPPEEMSGEILEEELVKWVPLSSIPDRRCWRDSRLAALAKLKNDLDSSK